MRARTDGLTEDERKILDDVEQHGLHIVTVPEDEEGPGFAFSVGLWENFEHPEVILFGLPPDVAIDLLNGLADEVDDGKQFVDGTKHDGLLANYPVRFVAVPREQYRDFLGTARWAYESDDFPAVQLVWPDKQGRWPWDAGVREAFRELQPVLGRKDATA